MMSRVLVFATFVTLGFPHALSISAQEPPVWIERTITLKITAERGDERIRVRGALYGVDRSVRIVDERTPIEWTATTTMFNGILQADDGKRIRVEVTEAGRKGGSSGVGTSVVVAKGLPAGGFLMFPGSAAARPF